MSKPQAKAEMLIRADPSSVFDAFVDPARIVRFWLASSSGPLAPGATVRWDFMVPGAHETVKVVAFSRPDHLAFDWSDGIQVDMRFAKHEQASTVVTVVATGLPNADEAVGATEGFAIVLCDLKALLETGSSPNLVRDKAALIAKGMGADRTR